MRLRSRRRCTARRPSYTSGIWLGLLSLAWHTSMVEGKTAADYFVKSMPGQPDGPLLTMHAG